MYTIEYDAGNHMLTIKRDETEVAKTYHIVTAFRIISVDHEHEVADVNVTAGAANYASECSA